MLSKNMSVRELMTRDVLTVERNQKLATAERDLFHGGLLRALGYGTRAKQQALDSLLVKEAMKSDPSRRRPTLRFKAPLA